MKNRTYTIFLALVLIQAGCLIPTDYPIEPEITSLTLTQDGSTAEMIIGFTDGDGNLGLAESDTVGVHCPDTCLNHWNVFCEYYELQNGIWVHEFIDWTADGSIPFYYRIPRIEPTGQNPALVGEIAIEMPFFYLNSEYDTARFEVKIVDRDLNESLVEATPLFIKP